jgi:hypothetical protein
MAEDIKFLLVDPQGRWMQAQRPDGTCLDQDQLKSEESRMNKNPPTGCITGVARNPEGLPDPSVESGMPWVGRRRTRKETQREPKPVKIERKES